MLTPFHTTHRHLLGLAPSSFDLSPHGPRLSSFTLGRLQPQKLAVHGNHRMPCKCTRPTSCVLEFRGERGHGGWVSAEKRCLVATHVHAPALGPVEDGGRRPVRIHPPSSESVVGRKDPKRGLDCERPRNYSYVGIVADYWGGTRGGLSCVAEVQVVVTPRGEIGACIVTALDCTSEGEVGSDIGILLQEGDHGQGCIGAAIIELHKEPIRQSRG